MESSSSDLSLTRKIIYLLLVLMIVLFATQPPGASVNLAIYGALLIGSLVFYKSGDFDKIIIAISPNKSLKMVLSGVIIGVVYLTVTSFIPGLSLGLPLVPQSIGEGLKFFIIVFLAPVVEEIFFRGGVLAVVRSFGGNPNNTIIPILSQAVIFAFAHLGAYITGFYNYANVGEGFFAIGANLSVFIGAFMFATLAGFLVTRKGYKNLLLTIPIHMTINFILFSKLALGTLGF